ncbi:MAG: Asr1405/Asl0597 family protein [Kovacikia sp.]
MNPSRFQSSTPQVLMISRCDRWQAYQRFQELEIPCHCSAEGYLKVEVNTPLAALQVKSVVQQLTASRAELTDWLERCWQTKRVE